MLREAAALQTADGSVSDRTAFRASAVVSWRALVAAAVLSIVLGAALFEGVAGERASVALAVRSGGFSREGLLSLPVAAQGPVSAAMGADSAAYRVSASNGGFAAASPAQRLSLRFGRSGVSVSSRATRVGLSLQAVGYGTSLRVVGTVAARVKANRVVYARTGLSEWYANGPLGLEQGFTIARALSGHPAGPLTLSIALSGNVHASLGSGGQSITLSRTRGATLRYSGLSVIDAHGRALHSWLELHAGRILLRVDARMARYPLRIDPFIQQGKKLTGGGEIGHGFFGSVALSSDGNTALIGAWADNKDVGAAWVFTRSGEEWTQQAKLTGGGEIGHGLFGSVALSSDGNTALIGGSDDNNGQGAAWVFTRSGSTWTQQAKLTGGGEVVPYGFFGGSVALSADGNTALIGGIYDNAGVGAAWVFTRSGQEWTQQGEKLTGGEIGDAYFGYSVALSSDGNTALIGGPVDNNDVGAAWVFTRSGQEWTQQGEKLTGSGEIKGAYGSGFGSSVALSADGNTALIGGDTDNTEVGAAWVFTRSGETWTQQGEKLTGGGEIGDAYFGSSVALSSDGNTALIGGPLDNNDVGAAWVFTRSGEDWTQQAELKGTRERRYPQFNPQLGASVALSSDGNTALIGAPSDRSGVGAAWVFVNEHLPMVVTGTVSSVTQTTATLNATVDPEGATVSDCHFEYGTSPSYGSSVPCPSLPGSGESPVAVSAPLENLSEATTYHFRIVATNANGTSYGTDQTFVTLANPPEYGRCIRVPAEKVGKTTVYHGGFAATCLVASGTHTGRYEWEAGVLKTPFKTKLTSGSVTLESAVKSSKMTCTGEASTGEYTGHKSVGAVVLTLTGCVRSTEKCSSTGAAAEEIVTNALEGELGVVELGATGASNKIGLDLYPVEKTGPVMEFSCGVNTVSVRGSVIVPVKANKMSLTQALKAKASKGKQKPESFVGELKDVLEVSFSGAPFEQAGLTLTATQTNEEAVEVNSVV